MLTIQGLVCGTPEYMSPEQARGEPLDGRADLYAAAVILYQLVTGDIPFRADSPMGIISRHLAEAPRPRAGGAPTCGIPKAVDADRPARPGEEPRAPLPERRSPSARRSRRCSTRPPAAHAAAAQRAGVDADGARHLGLATRRSRTPASPATAALRRSRRPRTDRRGRPPTEGHRASPAGGRAGRLGLVAFAVAHGARGRVTAAAAPRPGADRAGAGRRPSPPAAPAPAPPPPAPAAARAPKRRRRARPRRRRRRRRRARGSPTRKRTHRTAPCAAPAARRRPQPRRRAAPAAPPRRRRPPRPSRRRAAPREVLDRGREAARPGRGRRRLRARRRGEEDERRSCPPIYKFLGKCYMRAGRTREANENYKRYLELAPNAPDAPFIKSIIK